jgi:hypothetical protein
MKPQYGPTLGQLLAPRWHRASRLARAAVIATGVALLALIVAIALTFENSTFSHAGRVPFSFTYRDLYRTAPDAGGYVKVQRRSAGGRLQDSLAVEPLELPPYSGELSAELPLYAATYVRGLKQRYAHFVARGEGRTNVNTIPGYSIYFTAVVEGRRMYGRDVLLLPERAGAREGVVIVMLTSPKANSQVTSPPLVATQGVLLKPIRTFTIG